MGYVNVATKILRQNRTLVPIQKNFTTIYKNAPVVRIAPENAPGMFNLNMEMKTNKDVRPPATFAEKLFFVIQIKEIHLGYTDDGDPHFWAHIGETTYNDTVLTKLIDKVYEAYKLPT